MPTASFLFPFYMPSMLASNPGEGKDPVLGFREMRIVGGGTRSSTVTIRRPALAVLLDSALAMLDEG